jgi:hypothetical protein
VRIAFFLLLVAASPLGAQDLPDPGRRLTKEELEADPEKPRAAKPPAPPAAQGEHARDAQACERARRNYQLFCGAPNSYRSRSFECAEAYAFYRESC